MACNWSLRLNSSGSATHQWKMKSSARGGFGVDNRHNSSHSILCLMRPDTHLFLGEGCTWTGYVIWQLLPKILISDISHIKSNEYCNIFPLCLQLLTRYCSVLPSTVCLPCNPGGDMDLQVLQKVKSPDFRLPCFIKTLHVCFLQSIANWCQIKLLLRINVESKWVTCMPDPVCVRPNSCLYISLIIPCPPF